MKNLKRIEKIIELILNGYPNAYSEVEKHLKVMNLKDRYELLQYVKANNKDLVEFIENKIFFTQLPLITQIKEEIDKAEDSIILYNKFPEDLTESRTDWEELKDLYCNLSSRINSINYIIEENNS